MTVSTISAFDRHMMAIAVRMARRGLGVTRPNPAVGAVIANESSGEVIARSVTAAGGRPHAETIAIAAAGTRARGATIYVTLEPCSHHGHTGPCADAIIAAGLSRAVVGLEDPDPRVAGRGLDRLRAAGINVVRGVMADEARWVTRGHIVRVTERRPFVTLKMALDRDGNVPRGDGGKPQFVTGEIARQHGHLQRAQHDAILVGEGTVRDDDPLLTCRLPGLEDRSPDRIMLSRHLNERPDSRLALSARDVPFIIFCGDEADSERRAMRERLNVEIETVPTVGGRLWLPAVMETLVARGMTRLLVEGGPTLWRSFADAGLVDEVVVYQSGQLSPSDLLRVTHLTGPLPLTMCEHRMLGPDTFWRLRRGSQSPAPKAGPHEPT